MLKKAGRPPKMASLRVKKRFISLSPGSYEYILNYLKEKDWPMKGNFSRVINNIISDHSKVRKFKESESQKLKDKLEVLDG